MLSLAAFHKTFCSTATNRTKRNKKKWATRKWRHIITYHYVLCWLANMRVTFHHCFRGVLFPLVSFRVNNGSWMCARLLGENHYYFRFFFRFSTCCHPPISIFTLHFSIVVFFFALILFLLPLVRSHFGVCTIELRTLVISRHHDKYTPSLTQRKNLFTFFFFASIPFLYSTSSLPAAVSIQM